MLTYERTAAALGDDPDQRLAGVWLNYGSPANWSPGTTIGQSGLPIARADWSCPIFNAAHPTNGANTTITVYRSPAVYDQPARWTTVSSWPAVIPWRSSWAPGVGTDAIALVNLDGTGVDGWEIQNLRLANAGDAFLYWLAGITLPAGAYVCDQLCRRTATNPGSYVCRGAGKIPKIAGVLTAAMAAGGTPTALSIVGWNLNYGPGAIFRAPATRVEHPLAAQRSSTGLPAGADPRMIPNGLRLRLDYSDAELHTWAAAAGAREEAAFNVAKILVTHGGIVDETGGSRIGSGERCLIESTGTQNATEAAAWSALNMTTDAHFTNLLNGLFVAGRVKVVNVPGAQVLTPTRRRATVAQFTSADLD